jgi:GNAT superfamily N-acetyltransferase
VPESDDELRGMMAAQLTAFGEEPVIADRDVAATRDRLRDGGFAVLARDTATGAVAGGGVAEAVVDGVTEIAGVGVLADFRRRGIGAALTAYLTAAVHAAGARTVFLTPAGVPEQRIYSRVGFQPAGDMVHLSR